MFENLTGTEKEMLRKLMKQKQETIWYPFQLSTSPTDGNFFDMFTHLKLKRDDVLSLIDLNLLRETQTGSYRFTRNAYDVMSVTLSESEKFTLRKLMEHKEKGALYPFLFFVNNKRNFVEPNSNDPEFNGCDIETLIDFELLERDGNSYKITRNGYASLRNNFIFISYAWGDESEQIVNELDEVFQAKGVTIIRDKRDLGFKGRIQTFMEQIGQGKAVIVVISDKYLKSPNCMFELVQIAKNGQVYDRIFPIVLADAQIYDPVERAEYVEYWEKKIDNLDKAMKKLSSANLQGFREDIDQYTEIRGTIAELTHLLKDMNTLTPEMHRQSEFTELFQAVERKLAE